tara:strand:- start:261 stop:521 length:261 start_codon:yes stop_codon:yes gene_type:complete
MRNLKTWKYEVIVKGEKYRYRTRAEIKDAWGIASTSVRNIIIGTNSKQNHFNAKWQDVKINRIEIPIPKNILLELLKNERVHNPDQ